MCCWWQCCFRAHMAMPGVSCIDLKKSRKSSPKNKWKCKWGWSFCSTWDKHAPGDIIYLTSEMTAEAEQEQQFHVTSGKVTPMGVKCQGWVHASANGQKGIPKRAHCSRQFVIPPQGRKWHLQQRQKHRGTGHQEDWREHKGTLRKEKAVI